MTQAIGVARATKVARLRTASWARRLLPGQDLRWALAFIALGGLIRLGLLLAGWPATDSDEGTMGLMALHINAHGEWPLFFYGQSYMGTLQAYLGAVMFHLFGASVFSLRVGLLLLYLLFMLVMYRLLRLLYGQMYALVGLLLLSLGGPDLLRPQLLALGGYPETLLFGALSLLLALRLALGASDDNARPGWRRLALYLALGITMGLGWWSDQLIFPFLVAALLILLALCRREFLWWGMGALTAGLLVGLLPQFLFLITQPTANTPSAVVALEWQGPNTLTRFFTQFGAHLFGALLVALPNISGFGWLCAVPRLSNGALTAPATAGQFVCLALRGGWSVELLTLGIVATLAAWRALRAHSPDLRRLDSLSPKERRLAATYAGRLALLLGGALTLLFYLMSLASATPAGNARYLIEVTIALPALVYPLWMPGEPGARLGRRAAFSAARRIWRWVALTLLALSLLGGVFATYRASGAARASAQADQSLILDLERLGVHHVHTDYWICYKVAFLSQERITCDVLNTRLVEGFNRYPPYVATVQTDASAAYVFPHKSPQALILTQKAQNPAWAYTLTRMDGYDVYLPRLPAATG